MVINVLDKHILYLCKPLNDSAKAEDNPTEVKGNERAKESKNRTNEHGSSQEVLWTKSSRELASRYLGHHVAPEERPQDNPLERGVPRQNLKSNRTF